MRRLLIRPGAIGDCLLSFPALAFLQAEYTEIWISAPMVPLIGFADKVRAISSTGLEMLGVGDLPVDGQLADCLTTFDEIVSWYGTNREPFRSALQSLRVPCRFLKALPSADSLLHATDFFCAQVGAPLGAMPLVSAECITGGRDTVVIHPFSGSASKNWPLQLFRQLAERLNLEVEWLAGPEEPLPEAHRFDSLRELADWLHGARLYVGNDSGITHLAAAVGVSTIALFGATSERVWAPRGDHVRVFQQAGLRVEDVVSSGVGPLCGIAGDTAR